jgi:hypothetical protein
MSLLRAMSVLSSSSVRLGQRDITGRAPTLAVGHVLIAMFQFPVSMSLPKYLGTMGKITPNSNLIFEIELLELLTRDD